VASTGWHPKTRRYAPARRVIATSAVPTPEKVMSQTSMPDGHGDAASLRARLAADLAAGKTVSLSAAELADPELRRELPRLLEELTATAPGAPPPPLRVPGYTLLGEIGHGGMSTVWLARHEVLARHVALKIAPKWLFGDRRTQQRLLHEARAMARLHHPNVVAIHDILEVDGTVAIAMDWVDGVTLAQILQALPEQPAATDLDRVQQLLGGVDRQALGTNAMRFFVRVVRDVARAAEHVHRAGLLHLDVKPSNILIRRDGTPLLADFGVVREIQPDATHTRTFAGTPVYAAPEQLERHDDAFGAHTDVYGLGMTLYEMLAREQPLRQYGLTRVLQDVLAGRIPRLGARSPVPADLANVVHKAIAPEPRLRYASAGALADDLTAFLEHRPVTARPLTRVQRLRRWARYEPWKALLAAVLAVTLPALVGLGVYLQLQLPRIERVRVEEDRAAAGQLKHRAFQAYFTRNTPDGEPSRLLHEAMRIDPDASSLACLLAMAHEECDPTTAQLVEQHRDQVKAHLGLRLFETKVATSRPFFNDYEVGQLEQSADPVDKLVLALDRVFCAEDSTVEEAWERADDCLAEAADRIGADPLLFGLRAWTSRQLGADGRFARVQRTIRANWPDDLAMRAWLYYSQEWFDHDAALRIAEEAVQRSPREALAWEMYVGQADRRRQPDDADARLRQATDAGVTSDLLDAYRLQAAVYRDGKPAAERALRDIRPAMLTELRRLTLLRVADPDAAITEQQRLLREGVRSPRLLNWLYRAALDQEEARPGDVDVAWQLWHQQHPQRRALHWYQLGECIERRDLKAAVRLIGEMEIPRRASADHWRSICTMVISMQDWPLLERCARRWLQFAKSEHLPEASFYAALADLRQRPADDETYQHLAIATAPRECDAQWWAYALLESAWLRVHPGVPANHRKPSIARAEVAAFEAFQIRMKRPKDNPWNLLVRAEVAFAHGEKQLAIDLATRASRIRHGEPHAPPDVAAMIVDALERYRK
jgi:serine/threonine protein kinase